MYKFKNSLILIIPSLLMSGPSYANQDVGVSNSATTIKSSAGTTVIYKLPDPLPQKFNDSISLDRTFTTLDEFAMRLQSLTTLRTKITNVPINEQSMAVRIFQQTGSVSDLLNQVAVKFNATWAYDANQNYILFSYNKPLFANELKDPNIVNKSTVEVWALDPKNHTLRNVLTKWCKTANWQLVWNVKADYPISTVWSINGTFEEAINEVLKASQQTDTPLMAKMHDSNHVLEIYSSINK